MSPQAEGRLTSVVGAVFDRYGAVWAGGAGHGARPRRPVPDRLDHQDDDGRPRRPGPRRGAARPRRPARRAPGRRRLRRRDGPRRARALLGHAERAAEVRGGSARGAATSQHWPRPTTAAAGWRRRAPGSTTPTSATASSARSSPDGSVRPGGRWSSERLLQPARHAGDVVPAASRRPARLERRPLHGRPGPRAAHRHRGDGAGRAAVVHPRRPRHVGPGRSAVPAPTCWRPPRWSEMQRPVTADYGLGLMLGVHPGGRLVGHNGSMPGFLAALHVDPDSGIGAAVLANATTGIDPRDARRLAHRGRPRRRGLPAGAVAPDRRGPGGGRATCRGCGSGATPPTTCAGTTAASRCG